MSRSVFAIASLLMSCAASVPRGETKPQAIDVSASFKVIELPERHLSRKRLAFACNPDRVSLPNSYDGLALTQVTKRVCPEPFPINRHRGDKRWRDTCAERTLKGEAGSWAMQVTLGPQAGDPATWQLIYLTGEGQALKSPTSTGLSMLDYPRSPTDPVDVPQVAALFDFDGDGRSELVTRTRHGNYDKSFNLVHVWTAKGTTVTPFGRTAEQRLIEIADSNQDHRPDFFVDPYGLPLDGAAAYLAPQTAWALAVELSADGQVQESGATTQAHALARCPGSAGLRDTLLHARGQCVPQYLHCAKLWATPEAEVESALDAFCEAERYDANASCPTFRATWRRMYGAQLPFQLSQPAGGAP